MQEVWKLMKNLWSKTPAILPTAKRNHRGRIVTGPSEIRKLLPKEYEDYTPRLKIYEEEER